MNTSRYLSPRNSPIPLDASFVRTHGREQTENELKRIVCSVKFELLERASAFRLLGPEMSYHLADPHLPEALKEFHPGMALADVPTYTSSDRRFDLCFEDCWTGYFIARRFSRQAPCADLVLIHLDDHTDMMSTLLCLSGKTLYDPTSGAAFDPASCNDWTAAICSGAVNIGNFITPFYYSGCKVHVRHINNSTEGAETSYVSRESRRYELIPGKEFAAIAKSSSCPSESAGTYVGGASPERVLDGVPRAWTIIHIDLDYFINDFNGASHGESYAPDPLLRVQATEKLNRFFHSLTTLNPIVDRWLIATSPGFCSGCHWKWLLAEIEERIHAFQSAQVASM
jgi:hypothetical protein